MKIHTSNTISGLQYNAHLLVWVFCFRKKQEKFHFLNKVSIPRLVCLFVHFCFLVDIHVCRRLLLTASLQHITWFVSSSSSSFALNSHTHTQTICFRICIFRMHFNALVLDLIIKFVQRNEIFEETNEPEISIAISSDDLTCKILSDNIISLFISNVEWSCE